MVDYPWHKAQPEVKNKIPADAPTERVPIRGKIIDKMWPRCVSWSGRPWRDWSPLGSIEKDTRSSYRRARRLSILRSCNLFFLISSLGLQFFVSATAWYCKLCNVFMGDLHCASVHLKSDQHQRNLSVRLVIDIVRFVRVVKIRPNIRNVRS